MRYIHYYDSPLGRILLASDGEAVSGLWFEDQKYYGTGLDRECREEELEIFVSAGKWLDLYFSGKKPDFTPPLVMKTTEFRKLVWEILLTIPYGQTVTYGEIARKVAEKKGLSGTWSRAVGNAVGHNPISLMIPCHRVVGAGGKLTGYAGGIARKARLLELEGSLNEDSLRKERQTDASDKTERSDRQMRHCGGSGNPQL